jgi:glycosyltransferase involved in cell wall biosynthesis
VVSTAVIIPTYNNPEALRKTLLGYAVQQDAEFEIVIADDGSDEQTEAVLKEPTFRSLRLKHVWHQDDGFRLCTIRNRAVASTDAEYLIFADGDCIPRRDYVASHLRHAVRGTFLSGHRVHIPEPIHEQFTDEDILSHRVFDVEFLTQLDPQLRRQAMRLSPAAWQEQVLNLVTWRFCVFHGSNSSAWREDIERVNGFDEDFNGYGSEDRDMGFRLHNCGVKSRYLKFSLVQLHLRHPRPYIDPAETALKRKRLKQRFWSGMTRADHGLDSVTSRA